MARLKPAQTNFTSGEISPLLYGRPDLKAYANGLKRCRNVIVMPQGGAFRRWGTRYVGGLETAPPVTLQVARGVTGSQTLTAGSAYWIASDVGRAVASGVGRATITAYTNPTTVTATVTVAFAGSAGSPAIAAGQWTCTPARKARLLPFIFATDDAKVIACNADFVTYYRFTAAGVPEQVTSGGSPVRNAVTGITEAQLAEIQYTQSADILTLAHASWHPKDISRLAADDTSWSVGAASLDVPATYEAGHTAAIAMTLSSAAVGAGVTLTADSAFFLAADQGRFFSYQTGRAIITGYTSTTVVTVTVLSAFPSTALTASQWLLEGSPVCYLYETTFTGLIIPAGRTVTITSVDLANAAVAAWRSGDAGKYIYIDGGIFYVNTYVSTTQITATCMVPTDHAIGTYMTYDIGQYGEMTLESVAWNATNGYPNTCAIHGQRKLFAGTSKHPNSIWAGPAGDFFSLERGVNDADGFSYAIGSGRADAIRILSPGRILGAGTVGSVMTFQGDTDGVITPSAPGVKDTESSAGCAKVSPVRIGGMTLFAGRSSRSIHALAYDLSVDGYQVSEISALAEHMLNVGQAVEMASGVIQGPLGGVPIVWVRLNDAAGTLLGLTFHAKENVLAWHLHTAADSGIIESVCCIPNPSTGYDETWLAVKRTIGGVVTRTVEVLTPDYYLDCAVASTMASGTTITGLTHLVGEVVSIRGRRTSDSTWRLYPDATVSGAGEVTVSEAIDSYQVGLAYTGTLQTLGLQPPGVGNILGVKKGWSEIVARVYQTALLKLGAADTAKYSPIGYAAASAYTIPTAADQDISVPSLGYDADGSVTLTMDLPVPATILSIFGKVDLGD